MKTQGCGRIDNHQPHPWTRPTVNPGRLATPYACPGNPVIEGGQPCVECQRPTAACQCRDELAHERYVEYWGTEA